MGPHPYRWVASFAQTIGRVDSVLDLGGCNVNGSLRDLFPGAEYVALDIDEGQGVDIVADARWWMPTREFDVVLCTEVFEHTNDWPFIVDTAYRACRKHGGWFIATMAGTGRRPHGARGTEDPLPGEWYENITARDLDETLIQTGFSNIVVNERRHDLRAACQRL
jgi:SAM-dependent methyltransferase